MSRPPEPDVYQLIIDENRDMARERCRAAFERYRRPDADWQLLLTKLQHLQAEQVLSMRLACADMEIQPEDTERLVAEVVAAFDTAIADLVPTRTSH